MVQQNPFVDLSESELKVAEKMGDGLETKQIARVLGIAEGTVRRTSRTSTASSRSTRAWSSAPLWERWHPVK